MEAPQSGVLVATATKQISLNEMYYDVKINTGIDLLVVCGMLMHMITFRGSN